MKVTIEFNEEENEDLQTALDGYKWKLVSWDMSQKFREYLKYTELTDEEYAIVEKIKGDFFEFLDDYGLKLD
jgi:hypothetical protein